ncbi:MAG: gluconolaconase [Bryobacteraceae bacterium]|nr:gluconolaconase [Bryobacteraceae bacterium]
MAIIQRVTPGAAIPGGEFHIHGQELRGANPRPAVKFGDVPASVIVGSDSMVIAKVPEGASVGELIIDGDAGKPWTCEIGVQIADSLHPVANPAVDAQGNIYATFSGSRGQKTPVAVFKIDLNYNVRPFVTDMMNATGLAFGADGLLYVSSRHDGIIYQVSNSGEMSIYCEGMGTATGIAFDREGFLYVGDRSGTIFKIGPDRQIYVFATIEPSISAYHLAFDDAQNLYVTGPTTSSYDAIQRVKPNGDTEVFFRGLGRPQGLAFDADGNLYCCASYQGRRGVVRISPQAEANLFLSGPNIVGCAFAPSRALIVATNNAIFRVDSNVKGRPLP